MVNTYTRQLPTLCSSQEIASLKNVDVPSDLIEMIDNTPPTIDPLSQSSLLARVGQDRCKLVFLLITSNSRRVEQLEHIIQNIRAQCQVSTCAAENAQLRARMAAMEAEFNSKLAQANQERAGLQTKVDQLTRDHATCKADASHTKGLLDSMTSQLSTCTSDLNKAKHDVAACNREHEVTKVGYSECQLHIKRIDTMLDGEKKELAKCAAREQVLMKEKATLRDQLQQEAAKNLVCEDKAKCTPELKENQLLKGEVLKCKADVATLTGNVQNLHTQVGELTAAKDAQSKQISSLSAEQTKNSAVIASQLHTITQLEQKVGALSTQVTSLQEQLKTEAAKLLACNDKADKCAKTLIDDAATCVRKLHECRETTAHCDKKKVELISMFQKQIEDAAAAAKAAQLEAAKIAAERLSACQKDAAAAAHSASDRLAVATHDLTKCNADAQRVSNNLGQCESARNVCGDEVSRLKGDIAAKQSQISALKTEIEDLTKKHHGSLSNCEGRLATATSLLASSQATLQQCAIDRNSARVDAENLRKIREQQEERIRSLSSQVQAVTLTLQEKLALIQSLESKLKIETDRFNAAKTDVDILRGEVQKFRDAVAQEAAKIAALQKKYDDLSDKSSKEALALRSSIDALTSSAARNAEKLRGMEEQMSSRIRDLESMEAALKLRNKELQEHRNLHAQATVEKRKLEHALMVLTQLRDQAVKDLASRTALATKLQKQVDSLTLSLQSCNDSKREASKECKAKVWALTQQLNSATAAHKASVAAHENTKQNLRNVSLKLAACTADVGDRRRSEAELMAKLSKCQTSDKSCQGAKEQAQKRLQSCRQKNSEFRQMIKDLSSQHTSATSGLLKKLAAAQADAKVWKSRHSRCVRSLSASSSKISDQGTVIDNKQKQIDVLKNQLAKANALKQSLSAEIAGRVKKISQLKDMVRDKQNRVLSLMRDLSAQSDLNSKATRTLTEQIRRLKMEISEHKAEKKRLQAENLSLNHKYKQAVKQVAALRAGANADKADIAKLSSALGQYKTRIGKYQDQLDNARQRISGLAKDSRAATSKIAKMSSRIAKLDKNSAADQAEIARMASRIAKYRQELAKSRQSLKLIWQKMSEARKLTASLTRQRDDARALADRYGRRLDQMARDQQSAGDKRRTLQRMISRLNANVNALNSKLRRANAVKKNLKALLVEHKVMISGLRKILSKRPSQGQFDQLVKALRASRETIEALKKKLQQYANHPSQQPDSTQSNRRRRHRHIEINIHSLQEEEQASASESP